MTVSKKLDLASVSLKKYNNCIFQGFEATIIYILIILLGGIYVAFT